MGFKDDIKRFLSEKVKPDYEKLLLEICQINLRYFNSSKRLITDKVTYIRDLQWIEYQLIDPESSAEDQTNLLWYTDQVCKSILYDNMTIIDQTYRDSLINELLEVFHGRGWDDEDHIIKNGLTLLFINKFFDSKKDLFG